MFSKLAEKNLEQMSYSLVRILDWLTGLKQNNCNSTSSAGILGSVSIDMNGRTGFIYTFNFPIIHDSYI